MQRPCFVKDIGTISPTTAVAGRRLFSAPFHFFHDSFTYTDSTGAPASGAPDYSIALFHE